MSKNLWNESLQRLGNEAIDLYYAHRVDLDVPIEETIKGMVQLDWYGYWRRGKQIIPIPGTSKRKHLVDNVGAIDVNITGEDIDRLEALLKKKPDTGTRYPEETQKLVDED